MSNGRSSADPKVPKVANNCFQFGFVTLFRDQPEYLLSQYKLKALEIQIPRLLASEHPFHVLLDLFLFARYPALLAEILVAKVEFHIALGPVSETSHTEESILLSDKPQVDGLPWHSISDRSRGTTFVNHKTRNVLPGETCEAPFPVP